MKQALTDTELRATLIERGLAKVREYSWEQSVARIREVYEEVMQEPQPV